MWAIYVKRKGKWEYLEGPFSSKREAEILVEDYNRSTKQYKIGKF